MTSMFYPDEHPLALLSSTHSLCFPEKASALPERGEVDLLFYIAGESINLGRKKKMKKKKILLYR